MGSPVFRRGVPAKFLFGGMLVTSLYVGWVAFWASGADRLQPVAIGVDKCSHCGMIVSEERFSISILVQQGGHRVTQHFDDIGCYLRFADEHPDSKWVGVAHDYYFEHPIPLDRARFQKEKGLATPMGSGWIAITDKNY